MKIKFMTDFNNCNYTIYTCFNKFGKKTEYIKQETLDDIKDVKPILDKFKKGKFKINKIEFTSRFIYELYIYDYQIDNYKYAYLNIKPRVLYDNSVFTKIKHINIYIDFSNKFKTVITDDIIVNDMVNIVSKY